MALRDLRLDHLWIVHPGTEAYSLDERISVLPISGVQEKVREMIRPRARRV